MRFKRLGPPPFWFEEGSRFLDRLSTELGDIPHKVRPLLWSGANSIFVRDKIANVLAERISAEHAKHPQAAQLVIAHSHGGNIALRALHHLKQRADSLAIAIFAFAMILFGLLMVSRSAHGRELARSPVECQVNTQSAPDAVGLSKIVTLVRRTYVKSLRHGIYDHEDCAKTISDWVRSQL
jgi:hypothetical protein